MGKAPQRDVVGQQSLERTIARLREELAGLRLAAESIMDRTGDVVAVMGAVQDVTDERLLQRRLRATEPAQADQRPAGHARDEGRAKVGYPDGHRAKHGRGRRTWRWRVRPRALG